MKIFVRLVSLNKVFVLYLLVRKGHNFHSSQSLQIILISKLHVHGAVLAYWECLTLEKFKWFKIRHVHVNTFLEMENVHKVLL